MGALQGAFHKSHSQLIFTRPGASFLCIQVRGQNSLNSGNLLYVVDGIVVG